MSGSSTSSLSVASTSVHGVFWPTSEPSFSCYTLGALLFKTNMGEVRRVSLSSGGGPNMVVKISKLGSHVENPKDEGDWLDRLARGPRGLENLFPTKYGEQTVHRHGEKWHFLFMQDCGDDLFTYICRSGGMTEDFALRVFSGLLDAVEALHDLSICHLDLKPENILFDEKNFRVRVCDLGQAHHQAQGQYQSGTYGTPGYRAPELKAPAQSFCGFKADMYSLGVVLFMLLIPVNVTSWEAVFQNEQLLNQEMMRVQLGADVRNLITGLLRPASSQLSLPQVRSHPWINRP